jgi:hypothetical protein
LIVVAAVLGLWSIVDSRVRPKNAGLGVIDRYLSEDEERGRRG